MFRIETARFFFLSEKLGVSSFYLWFWRKHRIRTLINLRREQKFKKMDAMILALPDFEVIKRVAEDLSLNGIAKAHISEFAGMPSLEKMNETYDALLIAEGAKPHSRKGKSFIERLVDDDYSIKNTGDPLSTYLLNPGIAMACAKYLGLIPKLTSFKVWRSHQIELQDRTASQNWHRDYNEYQMVRVFYYFNDVTSDNGAGEYIRGSHFKGDSFDKLQDSQDGLSRYSTDKDVESIFSEERVMVAEGTAGTLFFMDTAGLHRGGFHPVPGERKVSLTTYSTAADLQPTKIRKPKNLNHIPSLMDGVLV